MRDLFEEYGYVIGTLVLVFIAFIAYIVLFAIPVELHTEAKCLEKGYPKHKVAWNLKGYCIKLDGQTYTVVDPNEH